MTYALRMDLRRRSVTSEQPGERGGIAVQGPCEFGECSDAKADGLVDEIHADRSQLARAPWRLIASATMSLTA
jgi:hypothetical protein